MFDKWKKTLAPRTVFLGAWILWSLLQRWTFNILSKKIIILIKIMVKSTVSHMHIHSYVYSWIWICWPEHNDHVHILQTIQWPYFCTHLFREAFKETMCHFGKYTDFLSSSEVDKKIKPSCLWYNFEARAKRWLAYLSTEIGSGDRHLSRQLTYSLTSERGRLAAYC